MNATKASACVTGAFVCVLTSLFAWPYQRHTLAVVSGVAALALLLVAGSYLHPLIVKETDQT